MTPSQNQHGTDRDYQNVFERAFDGHMDPMPLIQGINTWNAAWTAQQAAKKYNADEKYMRRLCLELRALR